MSRVFGEDIEKIFIDRIKDAVNGLNAITTIIDSERGGKKLAPAMKIRSENIASGDSVLEFPCVNVYIEGSQVGSDGGITNDIEMMNDVYTVTVLISIKEEIQSKNNTILNRYEEAIKRCLHGYRTEQTTWILNSSSQKGIGTDADYRKTCDRLKAQFEVRIN